MGSVKRFCDPVNQVLLLAPDTNSGAEIEIAAPFRAPHLKMPANQQLEKSESSAHPRLERATGTGPFNGRQTVRFLSSLTVLLHLLELLCMS